MLMIRPPVGHVPHGGLAGHIHGADVDLERLVDLLDGDLVDRPVREDARVVHEDVQPAEFGAVCSTADLTSSAAALSALIASASVALGRDAVHTSCALASDCAYVIATSAPCSASRAAMAAPIPLLPPVTSATFH